MILKTIQLIFKTEYYVRLDDAHPCMNHDKWAMFEEIIDKFNIKPIVAVIPSNEDSSIKFANEDIHFWQKVKCWQDKGWGIAIHGHNHIFTSDKFGIFSFNNYSEFAGLQLIEQKEKIRKALEIFRIHKIDPEYFIAPAHSFDLNTLKALRTETKIRVIIDGIALFPYYKFGFHFVPQQIWKFRRFPFGFWTCCFHPSTSNSNDLINFEKFVFRNKKKFPTNLENLIINRKLSFFDNLMYKIYFNLYKNKKINIDQM